MSIVDLVRRTVWRLIPPIEVQAVQELADHAVSTFDFAIRPPSIERRVREYVAANASGIVYDIRVKHLAAEFVALAVVRDVATAMLVSGEYEMYGAVIAPGFSVLALHTKAITEMRDRGFTSSDDYAADYRGIREALGLSVDR